MQDSQARLAEIGRRAARLCFADGGPCQDNICTSSCVAVVPGHQYLIAASEEVFAEYWDGHPAFKTNQ